MRREVDVDVRWLIMVLFLPRRYSFSGSYFLTRQDGRSTEGCTGGYLGRQRNNPVVKVDILDWEEAGDDGDSYYLLVGTEFVFTGTFVCCIGQGFWKLKRYTTSRGRVGSVVASLSLRDVDVLYLSIHIV